MATLSKEHRKLLENTVAAARKIAVAGAEKALLALRVGDKEAPSDAEQKELRSQLRAHGRQLGDRRQPNGTQETVRLEQAFAYEHWHRLLFARFLAENDLLVNPEYGVPMSLAEVQETAREQNCDWLTLASGYAQQMLLEVFRPDDPVLRVTMPPETRQQLEEKLASLPVEIFRADDSLGWVYQFWQRDEKNRVNESEIKIGADELSAVTQLFTEDYMVLFLLENTLGAWWTAKQRAEGKDAALPGYEWTYLRLNEDGSPLAGGFDGWPGAVRDLRVLDPSMGSGHFLTFALPILARMRMQEEGTSLRDAIYSVLRDNLFGLELDARCSQISAFNLALAAWRLSGEHFRLPTLNLACSGLGIHAPESDWVKLAGEDGFAREEMRRLYSLFKDAPTLGSLIDPLRLQANVFAAGADRVMPLIEEALKWERDNDETKELMIAAQGVLSAFRILAGHFTLVATNVPYLGRGRQDPVLAQYCGEFHSDAKADLATCFVDRCLRFLNNGGTISLVTPQNWLYQVYYEGFRQRLLLSETWRATIRLGPGAFREISGEVVKAALVIVSHRPPPVGHLIPSWNVTTAKTPADKSSAIREDKATQLPQAAFEADESKSLRRFARCYQGISTGDNPRMGARFWELDRFQGWQFFQVPSERTVFIGGRSNVIRESVLSDSYKDGAVRGREAWGRQGIAIARIGSLAAALYDGAYFANTVPVIVPNDDAQLPAIWAFVSSPDFREAVAGVNQSLSVDNGYLEKIPFDLDFWETIAADRFPSGLPAPFSGDPTQWIFHGHPRDSNYPLQVAVARLVGYLWPRQCGSSFPKCEPIERDGLEEHADSDGIVCLGSISGEASAADRLRSLLADAYGSEWSAAKLNELLGGFGTLETWLRDGFFVEHCAIFHPSPFVWHISDGRKDGFHALVNYHKLAAPNGQGRKTLEKLIYTSLGDWIRRQEDEVKNGVDGAEARLVVAQHLKAELINILHGEPPYDLFVRWKPLDEQPMGWEPDINDGVRLNVRPWLNARPYVQPGQKQKQDASILRVTPIKFPLGKDRGKEPLRDRDDFPWYATSQDRTNDLHFTLEEKRAARERKKQA